MYTKKRSITREISFEGVGLHTGENCRITFKPAKPDHGIKFIRADIPDSEPIPADIDHVIDIARGTTIGIGEAKVHTVEHVLAALTGLGIDNILIELSGPEPPVGDGSAMPFVELLQKAGFHDFEEDKEYLEIDTPMSYSEPGRKVDIVVTPSTDFRLTFMIDYANPALGTQYTSLVNLEEEFAAEFASARTFCFLSEAEELRRQGLVKGGSIDNAIVIYDLNGGQIEVDRIREALDLKDKIFVGKTGIINDIPLRYDNEPVRHKALDLIGDLTLIGVPIKGHILAARSGHKANVELVKKLRSLYQKKQIASRFQTKKSKAFMDINGILKIMPHRYPFLLIDRIIDLEPEKRVVAMKNVTINEPFFIGHFPEHPIMPGVLIVEAMAQAGGLLLLNAIEKPETKIVYFMSMDDVKFRKPVEPGDQLRFEIEMVSLRRGTCRMEGKTFVDDKLVTEAKFMAAIIDR
ncbi:MAG: bifunctional UDP-3-O-[3-hydroxymyristoyl] N-acetylglucosamine deacetylase/3-hydroxyacyl-ACP dehydratase [candidate division Zixibacteria bacterium]